MVVYLQEQLSAKKTNLLLINFKAPDEKDYYESLGQKETSYNLIK